METALDAKITFLVAAAQCCFTYDVTTCFYQAPRRGPVPLCPTQSASHKLSRKLDLWVCHRKSFLNAWTSQNILFRRTGLLCLIQYPPLLLQIQKASLWGRLSTAASCPAWGCPANSIRQACAQAQELGVICMPWLEENSSVLWQWTKIPDDMNGNNLCGESSQLDPSLICYTIRQSCRNRT